MKPLNRPMFKMGGPVKEGIMDGIEEPETLVVEHCGKTKKEGSEPVFIGAAFTA